MKILELHFQNLNSLSGVFHLDFSSPPLRDCGLFAITGPTGSGKTTVLDAITVSLFGKTPRLSNPCPEIISRFTQEAFAEIIFQVKGETYSSKWSVSSSSHGTLKPPKMILQKLTPFPEVLEDKLKLVPGAVAALIGLDFHQFTRSIMLVQESFSAFLMAKGKERAALLEELTGTEIYSRISMAAFERAKAEETLLRLLERDIEQLGPVTDEEIPALERERANAFQKIQRLGELCQKYGEDIKSLKKQLELQEEQEKLQKLLKEMEAQYAQEGPRFLRLSRSQKLAHLREGLLQIKHLQTQQEGLRQDVENLTRELQTAQALEETLAEQMGKWERELLVPGSPCPLCGGDQAPHNHQDYEKIFKCRQSLQKAREKRMLTQKHRSLLEENLEKSRIILQEESQNLLSEARAFEIISLEDLKDSLLSPQETLAISELKERLDQKIHFAQGKLEQVQQNVTREDPEVLGEQLRRVASLQQEQLQLLSQEQRNLGVLEEKIRAQGAKREKLKDLREKLQAQQKEFDRFYQLKAIIGSASGDVFRKFAQSLTLDRLLYFANKHLLQLNDRYHLCRRPFDAKSQEDLEISLVDTHQNGFVRPTDNLSGGEKFLISLALALGLSDLAGKNSQLESLFLDEGFGTLDGESLEKAMETLENLRHSGKIIGLISHVEALKERIPVQIQVIPLGGGRSRLRLTENWERA